MGLPDGAGARWIDPGDDGGTAIRALNASPLIRQPTAPSDGLVPVSDLDLSAITLLFRRVFSENIICSLGQRFVDELLGSYVRAPGSCGYVFIDNGDVAGFVLGVEDSRDHRRWVLARLTARLAVCVLRAMIVSPRLLAPVVRYLGTYAPSLSILNPLRPSEPDSARVPPASLVYLAVAPEQRRRGIAATLTSAFLVEMARRGVDQVKLVVTTTNEPAVNFYLTHEWQIAGRYPVSEGRWAYRMIYNLAETDCYSRQSTLT